MKPKSVLIAKCPVATTVQHIGDKWKVRIIRNLSGISQKILTDKLRSLEADDIMFRKIFAEVALRVKYSLSALAESMHPILHAMGVLITIKQQNSL